jgi:hypothetical protein
MNATNEVVRIQHVAFVGRCHRLRRVLERLELRTEANTVDVHDDIHQSDGGTCVSRRLEVH